MDVKIFVISLKDSVCRRKNIISQFNRNQIEFEFFDAIDANKLTIDEIKKNFSSHILNNSKIYNKGSLSCTLSHLKLYQRIIDEKIERALIFEDDVLLENSLKPILKKISKIPNNDVVLFHFKSHEIVNLKYTNNIDNIYKIYEINSAFDLLYSASAYIISKETCQILTSKKIECLIDNWGFYLEERYIKHIYTVYPFLVFDAGFKSTINFWEPKKILFIHRILFYIEKENIILLSYLLKQIRKKKSLLKTKIEILK